MLGFWHVEVHNLPSSYPLKGAYNIIMYNVLHFWNSTTIIIKMMELCNSAKFSALHEREM